MNKPVSVRDHLCGRGMDLSNTRVVIDEDEGVATFLLYNLSGQIVGYQQYRPGASKKTGNDPLAARYFTFVGQEGEGNNKKLAVWGLETVSWRDKYVFIVEGVFDAVKVHNAGHPCIAALANDPKLLRSWFRAMNKRVIAVRDDDAAGMKLANVADVCFVTPTPYKDLGEMPQDEATSFIEAALVNT